LWRSPDRHAAAQHRPKGEDAFAPYAGGAVFNTALALGRLGLETGFFTGLSSDMFGDILREALTASGVDHSYCATLGPSHHAGLRPVGRWPRELRLLR
jgi:sugar/nucleoside kinase (ribokinase family)